MPLPGTWTEAGVLWRGEPTPAALTHLPPLSVSPLCLSVSVFSSRAEPLASPAAAALGWAEIAAACSTACTHPQT